MGIVIQNPVVMGAAAKLGTDVPTGYTRKYTKCTVFNSTGGALTVKLYLVPLAGTASTTNQYVEKLIESKDTYMCPEIVGGALAATGFLWADGAGLSIGHVANDSLVS